VSEHISAGLADLVEDLNSPRSMDIENVMTRVVQFATETLGITDGSIFLAHSTSLGPYFESVVPTSPEVVKVDELQHDIGAGPAIDALTSSEPVFSPDLRADDRWQQWSVSAVDLGITGVISARLRARERTIGALNLYGHSQHTLSQTDEKTVKQLAKHVAATLAAAIDQSTLNAALLTRSVIARAQGLLMERYGVTEDRAFGVLKRISQDNNVKIREVAERVAAGDLIDDIDRVNGR
jgi:GAF domain-containing protein